jgi:putative RNA 2'-phosphotransferase
MSDNELVLKGKLLSYILRHSKDEYDAGLIDENGWMLIDDLVDRYGLSKEMIDDIVVKNNKSRYEYNADKTKIRARQGHSIPVDVELMETAPPDILYHGTCAKSISGILNEGLKPQKRLYVHLSTDIETATNVGARYGVPVVLSIDAKQMYEDGLKFYLSNNGVWLTKYVDRKYIQSNDRDIFSEFPACLAGI